MTRLPPNLRTAKANRVELAFATASPANKGPAVSTVFHTEDGHNESVGVAVGAFADPNFPAPRVSIYDSRRHRGFSCHQARERSTKIPLDRKL
jgi:hypothetical protein